jgi:manganese oxidase
VSPLPESTGKARVYFVAVEEETWDFGPSGTNTITGVPFASDSSGQYMTRNDTRIGSAVRKARYVEYTDAAFTTRKPVPPEWAHKGILGPVIRAEVGDEIRVTFLNRASRPYTMHPHGVEYLKADEGANYADGLSAALKPGSGVPPGAVYQYRWAVPARAGPGPADGSTVAWLYHSHADEGRDVASGLLGCILVSRAGAGGGGGSLVGRPGDVDREMVILFKVFDEAISWCAILCHVTGWTPRLMSAPQVR